MRAGPGLLRVERLGLEWPEPRQARRMSWSISEEDFVDAFAGAAPPAEVGDKLLALDADVANADGRAAV